MINIYSQFQKYYPDIYFQKNLIYNIDQDLLLQAAEWLSKSSKFNYTNLYFCLHNQELLIKTDKQILFSAFNKKKLSEDNLLAAVCLLNGRIIISDYSKKEIKKIFN